MSIPTSRPWLRHYDAHVGESIPYHAGSFMELLDAGMYANPGNAAYHYLGTTGTFGQLNDMADRFAAFLIDKGCAKGDAVGIHLPNMPQFLVAIVGSLRAGCIVSGVSPLLTPRELRYQLTHSRVRVLVTLDTFFEGRLAVIAEELSRPLQIVFASKADLIPGIGQPPGEAPQIAGIGTNQLAQVLEQYPPKRPAVDFVPDDVCAVQYTGGTTGAPKGVCLTQSNLLYCCSLLAHWYDANVAPDTAIMDIRNQGDVMCTGFPFFHTAGLLTAMSSLAAGDAQILVPDPRNTSQICGDMIKHGVTKAGFVPTLTQLLMDDPLFRQIDFSSLKFFISGGAPISIELLNRLKTIVPEDRVVEIYGMTETTACSTMNPRYGTKKLGSVGVPVPNAKVKIVSTEDRITEVPVGESGEFIISGPMVMKEYLRNPEATRESTIEIDGDAYLLTGDVLRMDEDGYLYVTDRSKDMMLVGGYNVYSREIEDVLYEIEEIECCAVVGSPNPERQGSDLVTAVIQLRKGDEYRKEDVMGKVSALCRAKLAPYKQPKIVKFTATIPVTSVGKVDKKAIRQQYSRGPSGMPIDESSPAGVGTFRP